MISRRVFLRDSAIVLSAVGTSPLWLASVSAQGSSITQGTAGSRKKILVVLFQRGAADGLNMIVPHGDPNYVSLRPTIAVPITGTTNRVIDLDGHFGLNPKLSVLKDLWDKQMFAVVDATGSPESGRSHFESQAYMESGTAGVKTEDGWLNRAMRTPASSASAFRLVSMGAQLPLTLRGDAVATSVGALNNIQVGSPVSKIFERMYRASDDMELNSVSGEAFAMLRRVQRITADASKPANLAQYGFGDVAQGLSQIARMIKSDLGVEAAFVDIGGWDHHTNEANLLTPILSSLATSIVAFCRELEDRMDDIVMVTMSEFGRTARENGNGGTDHGHGSLMLLFGGPVRGGKVYGDWRDSHTTNCFRGVILR